MRSKETKQQFIARQKRRNPSVTKAQLEQRWKQHVMSVENNVAQKVSTSSSPGQRLNSLVQVRSPNLRIFENQNLRFGVSRVVQMLIDADSPGCRIRPILGGGAPTGIFKSKQIFEIPTSTDSDNDGRFGAIFTPRLGVPEPVPTGFESIDTYANYILKSTSSYPTTSWRTGGNYEGATVTGSNVKDVDDAWVLARTPESRARIVGATSMTPALPFGTAPTNSQVSPDTFEPVMGSDGTNSKLTLPVGKWSIVCDFTGTGLSGITVAAVGSGSISDEVDLVSSTEAMYRSVVTIEDTSTDYITILLSGTTVTASTVYINSYLGSTVTDFGVIRTVRPLSMQVLATAIDPVLDRGGNLSIALLPQDALSTQALVTNSPATPGSPFFWEQLGRYQIPNGVRSGRFEEGGYCWWLPQDVDNFDFVKPSQMGTVDYPAIAVSGQYQVSGGGSAGGLTPLRVIVTRCFEYTSDSQSVSLDLPEVEYQDYMDAVKFLQDFPRVSGNSSHLDLIQSIDKHLHKSARLAQRALEDWGPILMAGKSLIGSLAI